MVSQTTLRSRLLALATGAGLAAGLMGTGAQAAQYQVGELEIFFDTTVSLGASVRTASRETAFLPEGNGGPAESRPILSGELCGTLAFVLTSGATCDPLASSFIYHGVDPSWDPLAVSGTPANPVDFFGDNYIVPEANAGAAVRDTDFPDNFDGSINGDDGRLNWDQGDFIGAASKVTHDLEINWRNVTFFTRATYFYDAVLNDAGSAARYGLGDDVRDDIGHGFEVLDAVVSVDFDTPFLDIPTTFRQGYQVINWGEATFFLNGISSINPIDVTAFRRPGAEIREALVPVHASFIQMALPYDLSLEAFYQWDWRGFELDPAGSPFSGGDIVRPFDGTPGLGGSFIGGSPLAGSYRRNCDTAALYGDPDGPLAGLGGLPLGVLNQLGLVLPADPIGDPLGPRALAGPSATLSPGNCNGSEIDMRYEIPIGMNEEVRIRNGDLNHVRRLGDADPRDDGQWGVALRYYADWLNATEFGFYFTNTHSRLPYVQLVPQNDSRVFIDAVQATDSAIGRQVLPTGCADNVLSAAPGDGFLATGTFAIYSGTPFPVAGDYETALGFYSISDPFNPNPAANGSDPNGYMAAVAPIADSILAAAGTPGFTGTEVQADVADGASLLTLMHINCALAAAQSGVVDFSFDPEAEGGLNQFAPTMATGAEVLNLSAQHGVRFQYPEDIRMYGVSFNTTVGTWGVQGELAYRDNMPLQIDTDSLTIASAALQCAFPAGVADLGLVFEGRQTNSVNCNPLAPSAPLDGFVREEVWTGDIGTTATFTASNPIIRMTGADLGILLTEFGFVYVPDARAEGDFSGPQLQNTSCQGSDLPLGGLLGLDGRTGCRPDDLSWGYLLFGRLDYNNVMGAFTVSPQLAFSHDVEGTSPSPISNYVEDTMSLNLSVGMSYQNTWRGSIGYTSFFGGGIENKSRDRDFASVSLSYSF